MSDDTIEKHTPRGSLGSAEKDAQFGCVGHYDLTPPAGGMVYLDQIRPFEHHRFANPAPLGLSAFGLTLFVLSCVNTHTRGITTPNIAVPAAMGYGGLVQLLSGMWEIAVGNTFGATVLSSYGGFWISYALVFHPNFDIYSSNHIGPDGKPMLAYTPEDRYSALGIFLTAWFIFTFLMMLCSIKSTLMFFMLFFMADLGFLLLACENYAGSLGKEATRVGLQKAGGVICMITAFLAFYNALAGLQDHSNSFFMVPMFPFPWSEKGRAERAAKRQQQDV